MLILRVCLFQEFAYTLYRETLTKGNLGEFDESSLNHQNITNQYKATMLSASIFHFNLLYKHCIE